MLTVDKITDVKDLVTIKKPWNDLLEKSKDSAPYLSYDWFKVAYDLLDNNKNLFILFVRDGSNAVGCAPFLISNDRHYGIPIKKIQFLNSEYTPFQDFILSDSRKEDCLRAITSYLYHNNRLWDLIELKEVRETSENMKIFQSLCHNNQFFFEKIPVFNFGFLPTNTSWEEGLSNLKSKTRKEFRRKLARMERLGRVTLECITEPQDIDKHLRTFFIFWNRVWRGKESLSSRADFYFKIAHDFSAIGKFVLYALLIDEEPIAYLYSIKMNKTLFAVKTTYNPSYYAFSPGVILFYKVMERVFEDESISLFDFGRGASQYKNEWNLTYVDQVAIYSGHGKGLYGLLRFKVLALIKGKEKLKAFFVGMKTTLSVLKLVKPKVLIRSMTTCLGNVFYKNSISKENLLIVYSKKISDLKIENEKDAVKNVSYRFATSDDVDQLAVAMAARSFKEIIRKFESNYKCFMASDGRRTLYYAWVAPRECQPTEMNEIDTMKDGDAFLSDFGPGLHEANRQQREAFQFALCMLSRYKYNRLITMVSPRDPDNIALLEALGFEKCQEFGTLNF